MTITLDSMMQRSPAMIFTDLEDIVVMMDADEGKYYELDAIGARIWTLLERPRSVAEMCEVLVEEYDVTPDPTRYRVGSAALFVTASRHSRPASGRTRHARSRRAHSRTEGPPSA